MAVLAQNGDRLRADQAGAADYDDLHVYLPPKASFEDRCGHSSATPALRQKVPPTGDTRKPSGPLVARLDLAPGPASRQRRNGVLEIFNQRPSSESSAY